MKFNLDRNGPAIAADKNPMASLPRYCIVHDGATFHAMWQCHNKDWLLKSRWAKRLYYHLLLKYKDRYQVSIVGYTFMDNHVHIAGQMADACRFSDFFRLVNSLFAKIYNQNKKRRGQVVMDRFKSPCIQQEEDLLKVMTYIDLNQLRAGKVKHPKENEFSSYHYYAEGKKDPLITPSKAYLALSNQERERQLAYQAMVQAVIQKDWKEKRPYSSQLFIGDPGWVEERLKRLKEVVSSKRKDWHRRFQERFSAAP